MQCPAEHQAVRPDELAHLAEGRSLRQLLLGCALSVRGCFRCAFAYVRNLCLFDLGRFIIVDSQKPILEGTAARLPPVERFHHFIPGKLLFDLCINVRTTLCQDEGSRAANGEAGPALVDQQINPASGKQPKSRSEEHTSEL